MTRMKARSSLILLSFFTASALAACSGDDGPPHPDSGTVRDAGRDATTPPLDAPAGMDAPPPVMDAEPPPGDGEPTGDAAPTGDAEPSGDAAPFDAETPGDAEPPPIDADMLPVDAEVPRVDAAGRCAVSGETGCAEGRRTCCGALMCCEGIPYPIDGICQSSCPLISDRAAKQDLEPVDHDEILSRVARLPMTTWSYRDEPGVRHIGPMAQDFHAAFGVGGSDRVIHPVDANGVALSAIQALAGRVEALEREVRTLRSDNQQLRGDLTSCERR